MTCFCGDPTTTHGLCHRHAETEHHAVQALHLYALDDQLAYRDEMIQSFRHPVVHVPMFDGEGTRYGRAAIRGIVGEIATASEPGRNEILNRCAYRAARLVAGGQVSRDAAVYAVAHAGIACGLPVAEVQGTVRGAFLKGLRAEPIAPTRAA